MIIIRNILRRFRFYRVDYGFATGRHWMEIDGKTIYQSLAADVPLRDEDVVSLVKGTIGAPECNRDPYTGKKEVPT